QRWVGALVGWFLEISTGEIKVVGVGPSLHQALRGKAPLSCFSPRHSLALENCDFQSSRSSLPILFGLRREITEFHFRNEFLSRNLRNHDVFPSLRTLENVVTDGYVIIALRSVNLKTRKFGQRKIRNGSEVSQSGEDHLEVDGFSHFSFAFVNGRLFFNVLP